MTTSDPILANRKSDTDLPSSAPPQKMPAINCESAPVHFDAETIASLLGEATLVERMLTGFRSAPEAPLRQRLDSSNGREILTMQAASDCYAGVKVLSVVPANAGTKRTVISGLYILFDFQNGSPLAMMDASELTAWRTAAVSAAAADKLARPDSTKLSMLGAGHLCAYLVLAHSSVRPIDRVTIWARDSGQATATATSIRKKLPGITVAVTSDIEATVRSADILSSATRATDPLIRGAWIRPGTHVDLVGSYRPDMREIDDAGVLNSRIFVDARLAALAEAGDLIGPISRGLLTSYEIAGDLSMLASLSSGRLSGDEITLFKSVGTATADLVAAVVAWERWVTRSDMQT